MSIDNSRMALKRHELFEELLGVMARELVEQHIEVAVDLQRGLDLLPAVLADRQLAHLGLGAGPGDVDQEGLARPGDLFPEGRSIQVDAQGAGNLRPAHWQQ